ncbi:MAG: hypothetical protein HKN48_05550 [Flavobacteriaceae bacterium]|nr:hypothetical protein [Flavobacteriaceae bacterium]
MNKLIYIVLMISCAACKIEPKPIDYGLDSCAYCSMNIMDAQHAAEIVTEKGKVFKFDAIECMLNDKTIEEEEVALFLVMDFKEPNTFLDATESVYLISENIPSPMGANLSAFKNTSNLDSILITKGGKTFTWSELKKLNLIVIQ